MPVRLSHTVFMHFDTMVLLINVVFNISSSTEADLLVIAQKFKLELIRKKKNDF